MSDPELRIDGGAGGTMANLDDLATLAQHSEEIAGELAGLAIDCHAILGDRAILASAPFNPSGVAAFEVELLGALDGRSGLTELAIEIGLRAGALRSAAEAYRSVDELNRDLVDRVRWCGGVALPVLAPVLAALVFNPGTLPIGLGVATLDWKELLIEHPGVVDILVGMSPGLLSALPGDPNPVSVPEAARLLGLAYPDGVPEVTEVPADNDYPATVDPPHGVGDLIAGLDQVNAKVHSSDPDQIAVRIITHPDGSTAYVVDIPGTKVWDPPFTREDNLNDLGTNIHAMGGEVTSREHAIAEALRRAGASSTDPVMLVGHSQGGIVAAQAAHDSANGGFDFNVTHVVTAASPIGRIDVPDHVQVLALENAYDVVPHLDAADNPDRANWTTVTIDDQHGTPGENHKIGSSYLPTATALDGSSDASVTSFRDSAHQFIGDSNSTMSTKAYALSRRWE